MVPQPPDSAGVTGIAGVFSRAYRFDHTPDVQADYARYLCVLVTGYLEKEVVRIIVDYVDALGNHSLSRYVSETLKRPGSMHAARILDLVKKFSVTWHNRLDQQLTLRHREAIGSLYASRNQIAHGEDVDLTYRQVQEDYKLAREVVGFVEEVVA